MEEVSLQTERVSDCLVPDRDTTVEDRVMHWFSQRAIKVAEIDEILLRPVFKKREIIALKLHKSGARDSRLLRKRKNSSFHIKVGTQ